MKPNISSLNLVARNRTKLIVNAILSGVLTPGMYVRVGNSEYIKAKNNIVKITNTTLSEHPKKKNEYYIEGAYANQIEGIYNNGVKVNTGIIKEILPMNIQQMLYTQEQMAHEYLHRK